MIDNEVANRLERATCAFASHIMIKPRRMPCMTASVRVETSNLAKIEATWNLTVCSEIFIRHAISLFETGG